jgi:hypothetical protein
MPRGAQPSAASQLIVKTVAGFAACAEIAFPNFRRMQTSPQKLGGRALKSRMSSTGDLERAVAWLARSSRLARSSSLLMPHNAIRLCEPFARTMFAQPCRDEQGVTLIFLTSCFYEVSGYFARCAFCRWLQWDIMSPINADHACGWATVLTFPTLSRVFDRRSSGCAKCHWSIDCDTDSSKQSPHYRVNDLSKGGAHCLA